ncbi:hypothetical protein [Nocardioides sp.]|uniref:hypothetical protein n=1 Tax=Nocardioides sp. TaxID=35761 RepID=UPI001D372B01|nr:hypothetical protein [Nocardioides sp.]MBU1802382.1 hypothetical protein [Actinomycetota bacterium]
MTVQKRVQRRAHRRTYREGDDLTCAGCKGVILAGEKFWRGITREPWHPACRRLNVNTAHPITKRYLTDDPVGQSCGGCGCVITEHDTVVHKLAKPWHKECILMR